jgi:hypothetical protein
MKVRTGLLETTGASLLIVALVLISSFCLTNGLPLRPDGSCAGPATQRITADAVRPEVIEHSPLGKAVGINSSIEVVFSKNMNHSTVTVHLTPEAVGSSKWSGDNLSFILDDPLMYSQVYVVNVTGNDTAGNPLQNGSFSWSFTTTTWFNVLVQDRDQKPISGAIVRLFLDGVFINQTTTPSNGFAAFYLTEGNYTIAVAASGKTSFNETVPVGPSYPYQVVVTLEPPPPSNPGLPIFVVAMLAFIFIGVLAYALAKRK